MVEWVQWLDDQGEFATFKLFGGCFEVVDEGLLLLGTGDAFEKVAGEGGTPEKIAMVRAPAGITMDAEGRAWIISRGMDPVQRLAADGSLETVVAGRPFRFPHDIVLDEKGAAFVTDGLGKAIWHVVEGAEPLKLVDGAPLVNPVGISRQGGKLVVVDSRARSVFTVDSEGQLTPLAGPDK